MNINDLTIGQAREIASLFSTTNVVKNVGEQYIGKYVIIRTYSAGVWFGVLSEKAGSEVILTSARRMWRWKAAESISLSAVAKFGINNSESKIAVSVDSVWLEAIEIMPVTEVSKNSIEGADNVKAE